MTREDALKRLQQCRDNQPEAWQVIVSRDIVDTLLEPPPPPSRLLKESRIVWWHDPVRDERVVSVDGDQHRITADDAIERGFRENPIMTPVMSSYDAYLHGMRSWLEELFAPAEPPFWLRP